MWLFCQGIYYGGTLNIQTFTYIYTETSSQKIYDPSPFDGYTSKIKKIRRWKKKPTNTYIGYNKKLK